MSTRRRKKRTPHRTGGSARHPNSLANLRPGGGAPNSPTNAIARTHGAYSTISRETLDEKTKEVYEAFAADAPLRGPDGDLPREDALPVRLLAEALVRLEGVTGYLNRRGWEDDDGLPRPAVEIEQKLRREAFEYGEALGLSPRSRAKLGLDLRRGYDLAQAMSDPDPSERDRRLGELGLIEGGDEK